MVHFLFISFPFSIFSKLESTSISQPFLIRLIWIFEKMPKNSWTLQDDDYKNRIFTDSFPANFIFSSCFFWGRYSLCNWYFLKIENAIDFFTCLEIILRKLRPFYLVSKFFLYLFLWCLPWLIGNQIQIPLAHSSFFIALINTASD